jgi:hypothetical protein
MDAGAGPTPRRQQAPALVAYEFNDETFFITDAASWREAELAAEADASTDSCPSCHLYAGREPLRR